MLSISKKHSDVNSPVLIIGPKIETISLVKQIGIEYDRSIFPVGDSALSTALFLDHIINSVSYTHLTLPTNREV